MQLTPRELRYIEAIKRDEGRRRWYRWVSLFGCLAILVGASGLFYLGFKVAQDDLYDGAILFSIAFTKAYFYLAFGACMLGMTIRDWNGNMDRILLLKLIESSNSQPPDPNRTGQPTPTCTDAGGRG